MPHRTARHAPTAPLTNLTLTATLIVILVLHQIAMTSTAPALRTMPVPRHRITHGERGEAVPWLIVLGAGIGIAYFAGDSVMDFARGLVGNLNQR